MSSSYKCRCCKRTEFDSTTKGTINSNVIHYHIGMNLILISFSSVRCRIGYNISGSICNLSIFTRIICAPQLYTVNGSIDSSCNGYTIAGLLTILDVRSHNIRYINCNCFRICTLMCNTIFIHYCLQFEIICISALK